MFVFEGQAVGYAVMLGWKVDMVVRGVSVKVVELEW